MTKTKPTIKITTALLCDDVRREKSGKDILIGVYTGDILLSELPAKIELCLWLLAETRISGEFEREVRAVSPEDTGITTGILRGTINKNEKGSASFALSDFPLTIEKEGELKFQWRAPKGRWSTVLTKNVRLNPNPTTP